MKKITFGILSMLMLLTLNPATSNAATEIKQETTTSAKVESDALIERLYEINDLDKSAMSSSEKKVLRNEVLSIREQLFNNPVIYISGGALLLIIILLIILL